MDGPDGGATFSESRVYRYTLWRQWDDGGRLNVIGLNPSTADESTDDPTIRRCIGYAKDWGFAGLTMTNLFGFRSTDPKGLLSVTDPSGPDNLSHVLTNAKQAGLVLAAWGSLHPRFQRHGGELLQLLVSANVSVWCLQRTKHGFPVHPLYQRRDLKPVILLKGDRMVPC